MSFYLELNGEIIVINSIKKFMFSLKIMKIDYLPCLGKKVKESCGFGFLELLPGFGPTNSCGSLGHVYILLLSRLGHCCENLIREIFDMKKVVM